MTVLSIVANAEPDQVISLSVVRSRHRPGDCRHRNLLVDPNSALVECKACGEKLNPIAMLLRFANEETRWKIEREKLDVAIEKLGKKRQCKCEHCEKMTHIRY